MMKPLTLWAMLLTFQGNATYTVDLVNAVRSTEEEFFSIPQGQLLLPNPASTPTHTPPNPELPVQITAIHFDKTAYLLGEPFLCELTLNVTGEQPIRFPLATQAHEFRSTMPGATAGSISINLEPTSHFGEQLMHVESLYGAESVPGSLVTMLPGQSVQIRLAGSWRFRNQNANLLAVAWPLTVTPQIQVIVSQSSSRHLPARSRNNSSITLMKLQ